MAMPRGLRPVVFLFVLFVSAILIVPAAWGAAARTRSVAEAAQPSMDAEKKGGAMPTSRKAALPREKEITKRGDTVLVTRQFVDKVRKNNDLVLSKVAIKTRLDKDRKFLGYELVQIDRGSAVEKMGFKPKDVITGVNDIPARELNENRTSLESSSRFDVEVLRRGGTKKLLIEIR